MKQAKAILLLALLAAEPVFAADGKEISVLVPRSTAAVPFLLMAADGYLEGATLRVDTFLLHPQALALLMRGEVDLLFTGTSQGWENRLDGSSIVMIDTGVWGMSSMVARDPGIKRVSDLKGKRVALPFPGAPLDFQTRYILARERIDPERDLRISYGAFTQSLPRLIAGQLDAVAIPEYQATVAVKERGLVRSFNFADEWGRVSGGDRRSPQVSLFATGDFARARPALLVSLTEAWRKAAAAVTADPASAAGRFAPVLSVESAILEEALRNTLFEVPSFADNKAKILAYYGELAAFIPGAKPQLDEGFFFAP